MTIVLVLFVALFFTGCASTSAIKTAANGDRWEVRSNRMFWQTENIKVKTPDGVTVEVRQTKADSEALGSIIGAAIKAAK